MKLFKRAKPPPPPTKSVSRIQLLAACLGSIVIVLCAAILIREVIGETSAATPSVSTTRIAPVPAGRIVEVKVSNPSGRTLSDVMVSAATDRSTLSATLDYLPAKGERTLSFVLPADGDIDLTVDSWTEP